MAIIYADSASFNSIVATGSFSGSVFGYVENTQTASISTSITNLNTTTASLNSSVTNLNTTTASLNNSVTNLNRFTSSAATTGSNNFNGNQTVTGSLTTSNSLVVSGSLLFTQSVGVATISATTNSLDINTTLSGVTNTVGGIRIYATNVLTATPNGAAIQFYPTGNTSYPGQFFIDSGADNNAALIFRTAAAAGTIQERMRVSATGTVSISGSLVVSSSVASIINAPIIISGSTTLRTTIISGSLTLTGSLNVSGSFALSGSISTSGSITNSGQSVLFNPRMIAINPSQSFFNITGSLQNTGSTIGSQMYGVNINPLMIYVTGSQTQTALKVTPQFSGSSAFTSSQTNNIVDFGAVGVGSQFVVNDITSGSIYQVNDISGLPIIEALSDWTVNMYNYPTKVFQKTGSAIIISGSMNISGSLTMSPTSSFVLPLTAAPSPATGSAYWSGSFLFIYNGTKYVSASFA